MRKRNRSLQPNYSVPPASPILGFRADQLQEICSSFAWASDRSLRPNLWRSDRSFEFFLEGEYYPIGLLPATLRFDLNTPFIVHYGQMTRRFEKVFINGMPLSLRGSLATASAAPKSVEESILATLGLVFSIVFLSAINIIISGHLLEDV